jgi:hypothetical protein
MPRRSGTLHPAAPGRGHSRRRDQPVPAGTPLRCGAESTFECPAGHAELAGDGGLVLSGGKQNAGVGDLFAGQGAGAAADSATLAGGVESFTGTF